MFPPLIFAVIGGLQSFQIHRPVYNCGSQKFQNISCKFCNDFLLENMLTNFYLAGSVI